MLYRLLNKFKYWRYHRKHDLPHPDEIYPFAVKSSHLREFAKLYWLGLSLDECAAEIEAMKAPDEAPRFNERGAKLPRANIGARLFLGRRHTRERLRQILWKLWRDQHVARRF